MLAWFLKSMAKGVACLPARWAQALGRGAGWVLAHGMRLRRTYVLEVLARSFPEKTPDEHREIYAAMCRHQALNLVEILRFAGGREEEIRARIEVSGEEVVKQALERGKGVLVLIAHFGNYDLMGLFASRLLGYPVTIITKTLKNQRLNELWWELRQKAGLKTLPSHNAYRACVRALRRNELVGFMLDQNRPSGQGVFVDFFGKPASTTPGLAMMSAQTGAPVVPVFMRRRPDGRHVLEALPVIEPPPDRKEETLRACTAAYTKIIEDEIRRDPAQWMWLHKRWKSRPANEAESAPAKA
ncbi:MAG TPA: lysophospholipid acyltransferase family protein [Kiritimatiellia bacterium]|nr:lysophospholipid acyltransferase family protein [Kiritimatiellia bacterium]